MDSGTFAARTPRQPMSSYCQFCGTPKAAHTAFPAAEIQQSVRERFTSGDYAYKAIMAAHAHETLHLCKTCALLLKRTKETYPQQRPVSMLPADHVIDFMLRPDKVNFPDIRNLRCILNTFKHTDSFGNTNLFFSHPQVHAMAKQVLTIYENKRDEIDSIMQAWWTLNGNCTFFGTRRLGRLVRHAVKRRRARIVLDKAFHSRPK